MTVLETLNWATNWLKAHGIRNPRSQAELLLAQSLSLSREGLYTHLHSSIGEREKEALEESIRRRISGVPLQHLLGRQEFWSIDFRVDSRALIPRPETELLVEQALLLLSQASFERTPAVLEIGTGSGAIVIALAKERKDIFLVATDISWKALLLARENAKEAGVFEQILFLNGDLFGPFCPSMKEEPFDLIVSNPPYVMRSEIDDLATEVKDYEPMIALNGGEDGLDLIGRILSQSPLYLRKGGWLLLEVGWGQGAKVVDQMERDGSFSKPELVADLSGIGRVVKAQKRWKGEGRKQS